MKSIFKILIVFSMLMPVSACKRKAEPAKEEISVQTPESTDSPKDSEQEIQDAEAVSGDTPESSEDTKEFNDYVISMPAPGYMEYEFIDILAAKLDENTGDRKIALLSRRENAEETENHEVVVITKSRYEDAWHIESAAIIDVESLPEEGRSTEAVEQSEFIADYLSGWEIANASNINVDRKDEKDKLKKYINTDYVVSSGIVFDPIEVIHTDETKTCILCRGTDAENTTSLYVIEQGNESKITKIDLNCYLVPSLLEPVGCTDTPPKENNKE